MKNFLRFYLIFSLIVVSFSCSEDDSSDQEPEIRNGGEVFTSQLVTIDYPNVINDVYNATLEGASVELLKISDEQLVFLVPSDAQPGNMTLIIPDLNSLQINYQVLETLLTDTGNNTINQFLSDIDVFVNTLEGVDGSDIVEVRDRFSEVFDGLNDSQKEQTALFYEANRGFIAEVLTQADLSRASTSDTALILKFKVSGVAFSAGVALAVLGVEPIEKSVGVLVAVVALKKFNQYKREIDSRNLKVFSASVDGIAAALDRNDNTIEFQNGQEKSLNFEINRRDFIASDTSEGVEGVLTFFNSVELVNVAIGKLNSVITFVNDNLFFSNISLVNLIGEQTGEIDQVVASNDDYEGFEFTVVNSNVEITQIGFDGGQLKITLNVINQDLVQNGVVQTQLRYNYNDDFNSVSGSFDISINVEEIDAQLLLTTWYLTGETENGVDIFDVNSCNVTVQFTETQLIATEFYGNSCESSDEITSNYEVNGNIITETADGDTSTITVLELTPYKMVLQEVDGDFTYVETYTNIFGTWTINATECDGTNVDYTGLITLNTDFTVIQEDDSNGNYITNYFTFENNVLFILTEYMDPTCNGTEFRFQSDTVILNYDSDTNSFSGTGNTTKEGVSAPGCNLDPYNCNYSVTLSR